MFPIGADLEVRLAEQTVLDRQLSCPNRHRCLSRLVAGENEMISGVQFASGLTLKRVRHSLQQSRDAARMQRTAHLSHGLVRITLRHVRLSVRAAHDLRWLALRLQCVRLACLIRVTLFLPTNDLQVQYENGI